MPRSFVDPTLGHTLSFSEAEFEGRPATRIEMLVRPGGGVPPHVHPVVEETFEVLEGQVEILEGRSWHEVGPGMSATARAGTRHAYRNRGDVEARVVGWATPPSAMLEQFLADAAELGAAGRLTRQGIPKTPTALLQAAVLSEHYREMVVLSTPPLPPFGLDRLLFPPLARLGRKRGYLPGSIMGRRHQAREAAG